MNKNPYIRHKKPLNSDMNVVPYIDVMLVLLIIFMVAAPMLTTGVEVNLPKESTQNIQKDHQLPIIVSLRADGSLFISYNSTIDEPITEDALMDKLITLTQNPSDETTSPQVLINADADNEYRRIMHLMASLQSAGISKVGLLTDQPK